MLSLALLVSLPGCGDKMRVGQHNSEAEKNLVIPDFPTAREQFAFAKMYKQGILTSPELKKRREQMDKLAQYYNRVLINFPGDTTYVPLTYLELGDCAAQSDYLDQAIQAYQHAMSISQDEFIRVRAMFSIARIYDVQKRFVEGKALYKQIVDEHKNTESGRVKDVVRRAYEQYLVVQEAPAKTTR